MRHLLDVNVLLALAWTHHPDHQIAHQWVGGRDLAVCPLAELGFLRLSNQPKALNMPMADARSALEKLLADGEMARIPDDLPALDANAKTHGQVTDHYLAALASKHGLKFATFDTGIKHAAVVRVG